MDPIVVPESESSQALVMLLLVVLLLLLLSYHARIDFGHIEKGFRCGKLGHLAEVERVVGLEVNLLQWGRHLPSLRGSSSGRSLYGSLLSF